MGTGTFITSGHKGIDMTDLIASSTRDVGVTASDKSGFTVNAIRAGTVAHSKGGEPFTFTAELLSRIAGSWVGGAINYNHMLPGVGTIVASEWEAPYVVMRIDDLGDEVNELIQADKHNGFSIDANGDMEDESTIVGTGISILFDTHTPACGGNMGCGVKEPIMADDNIIAENEANKLQVDVLTGKLADAEALIAEKDASMTGMFTQENVDTIVAERIKAEAAKEAATSAAKAAVAKIFPKEIAEDSAAAIENEIMAENYLGAIVAMGNAELKAVENVPTEGGEIVAEEGGEPSALDAALLSLKGKYIGGK